MTVSSAETDSRDQRIGGLRRSVLLGLDEAAVLIVESAAGDRCGVESGRGVFEGEAHLVQLLLDFLYRLGTEVPDVEEVLLAAGDELTHGVDASRLRQL